MLRVIEKTKIWFGISLLIIALGIFKMATSGLDQSIEFVGGTVVQVNMGKTFDITKVNAVVLKYAPDAITNKATDPAENNSSVMKEIEIQSKSITDTNVETMVTELKAKFGNQVTITEHDHIGTSFGAETRNNAILAIIFATLAMLLYVGIRFEFKFGTAAIIAIIHDVLIVLAVYAWFRIPIDSGFIAAMLTVIGYSICDTIVVFDRIRENQKWMVKADVEELANASITQTMARSLNTVLTVLITLVAVYIFVPTIRNFSFPLIVGIVSGCYSSIFIASPLWVILKNMSKNKKQLKAVKSKQKSK